MPLRPTKSAFRKTISIMLSAFALAGSLNSRLDAQEQSDAAPGPANFDNPPADIEEAKRQMQRMIDQDYDYWTGGGQRKLNINDIGRLQKESRLRDGQAALIGSLALAMDWRHGLVDRLGKDELMALANGDPIALQTTRRFDKTRKPIPPAVHLKYWAMEYQKEFASMVSNVGTEGLSLWGDAGQPTVRSIHQGQVGDCYFLSAVEAVALKRPEMLQRTIVQTGPDTFELRFAGREHPMHVRVTEADMAQFNTDKNDGCWLAALALGEARIRDARKATNEFWRETSLGVLTVGGSQCQVLNLLTGHHYRPVSLRKSTERRVREIIRAAMERSIPVGLTSSDHTLSIKDYDPSTDSVLVLNPWGTSDRYKLPKSGVNVQMEDGYFRLPLPELCRCFATINVPESLARG